MKIRLIIAIILYLGAVVPVAQAARVWPETPNASVSSGQVLESRWLLDTQGQRINALEGTLVFPAEIFALKDVRDGGSLVNYWVERPSKESAQDGRVRFSGVVPGGYLGNDGLLFTAVWEATGVGEIAVRMEEMRLLLNDGEGTPATALSMPLSVRITQEAPGAAAPAPVPASGDVENQNPPEPFAVLLARDPHLYGNQWFITFAAQDKGEGISHYEVKEGWRRWKKAESPMVLESQWLDAIVKVRAVDRAGNVREAFLPAQRPWFWPASVIFAILLLIVAFTKSWRRRLWNHKEEQKKQEP